MAPSAGQGEKRDPWRAARGPAGEEGRPRPSPCRRRLVPPSAPRGARQAALTWPPVHGKSVECDAANDGRDAEPQVALTAFVKPGERPSRLGPRCHLNGRVWHGGMQRWRLCRSVPGSRAGDPGGVAAARQASAVAVERRSVKLGPSVGERSTGLVTDPTDFPLALHG